MSDRHEQARAEAERQIHVYGDDFKARTLRANLNDAFVQGVAWADANPQPLPRPGDGCQCTGYSQDAGGGHFEYLVEYEPACPEHSEHVYNPRTGAWEHANPKPHTITRDELRTFKTTWWLADRKGLEGSRVEYALRSIGIEVEDDA